MVKNGLETKISNVKMKTYQWPEKNEAPNTECRFLAAVT